MEYIKNFFLKHIGYAIVFVIFFSVYNIVAAIFMIFATIIVSEYTKERFSPIFSHPFIIILGGILYLYCFYIFKNVEVQHQFYGTTITFPFTGLMLTLTFVTGVFFSITIKKYVLLK